MSKKAVCSAEIMVVGNVDLLSEILLRVPAKSLVKFKSVSKQWLSLISDSHFCRNHTRQNPSPPVSGLYHANHHNPFKLSNPLNNEFTRIPFLDDHRPTTLPNFSFLDGSGASQLKLHHSSNGLMLCSKGDEQTYLVCNLTTQKFVVLPKLAIVSKSDSVLAFQGSYNYLIYDPTKSLHYKVVVVNFLDKNTAQFDMYSSESGSWKGTVATPGLSDPWPVYGAIWNGAIFLMTCTARSRPCQRHYVYFRFDIDAEKLSRAQVASPDTNISKGILHFGECGGRLFLIPTPCEIAATEYRVLEMMHRENEFQWTVKYIIDATPLILPERGCAFSGCAFSGCAFSVMGVMNVGANGNDLTVVVLIWEKVVQYSIRSKSFKVLFDFPMGQSFPAYLPNHSDYSYQFIQSLAPI